LRERFGQRVSFLSRGREWECSGNKNTHQPFAGGPARPKMADALQATLNWRGRFPRLSISIPDRAIEPGPPRGRPAPRSVLL
jgi:hypothetical protein